MTSKERIENSPQYEDGKFHNAVKDIYDVGAAWRAAIKELLFGKRVDPVPQKPFVCNHRSKMEPFSSVKTEPL